MPFWSKTALATITNKEDKQFLLSMMSDRKAVMSGVDSKLSETEKKIAGRRAAELKRKHTEEERMRQVNKDTVSEKSDSIEGDSEDPDVIFDVNRRKHRRTVKTGQNLFIPHDILKSPLVVSAAIRNKIKPTGLSLIVTANIESYGGDTYRFNLNHTQSYR